jgi:hypothetical protein
MVASITEQRRWCRRRRPRLFDLAHLLMGSSQRGFVLSHGRLQIGFSPIHKYKNRRTDQNDR